MTRRRTVRVDPAFFDDLDRQLGSDRGPNGEPSSTDFIVIDLPTVVDEFAENFDTLPIAYPEPVPTIGCWSSVAPSSRQRWSPGNSPPTTASCCSASSSISIGPASNSTDNRGEPSLPPDRFPIAHWIADLHVMCRSRWFSSGSQDCARATTCSTAAPSGPADSAGDATARSLHRDRR